MNPLYHKKGTVILPYVDPKGKVKFDTHRKIVVMQFEYTYPDGITETVSQAFYKSTGSNSGSTFGPGVTNAQAKGTWIPTNGIVVKSMKGTDKVCFDFILKEPFVKTPKKPTVLSRFMDDPQIAFVSYAIGGGVWKVAKKRKELYKQLPFAEEDPPGFVKLTSKTTKATPNEANAYIDESVSWNWHPDDTFLDTIGESGPVSVEDLNVEVNDRYFVPYNLLKNPLVLKSIKKRPQLRKAYLGPILYPYTKCLWELPENNYRKSRKRKKKANSGGKKRRK